MSRLLAIVALLALALSTPALAAGAAPRTTLNDVERDVMCVTCGVPLAIAESPQASQERREIQRMIDQGLTKPQIIARLEAEYGPNVRALPKDDGFGLAAYLVPIGCVLAALALLAYVVPRWRRRRGGDTGASTDPLVEGPALSDDDARRLDADLARYEV